MNRSLKEALSLILFLTAISVQLCQAYPEPSTAENEKIAEEFATDVQTLSQIEEENTDRTSEGDLKRQSRKVPCPFHKLKSGITKAVAIPCGAAAGAAAAAIAGRSVGGSIGGTSVGGSIGGTSVGGSIGGTSVGGNIGGTSVGGSIGGTSATGTTLRGGSLGRVDNNGVRGGVGLDNLANGFDVINQRALEVSTSLQGAINNLQELFNEMPDALRNLKTNVETINAPAELHTDVIQTCDSYAQAEKGILGVINYISQFFKIPIFKGGQVQVRNNFGIGSCLDNIRANMMSFLATIQSWFSCDKLFLSNQGISKFQSYINSIPSSSQCSILNSLGKPFGSYGLFHHGNKYDAVGGSTSFSGSSSDEINAALVKQQLQETKQVLEALQDFPSMFSGLMEGIKESLSHQANQITYTTDASQGVQAQARSIHIPVASVYGVPTYPYVHRTENAMPLTPSVSGQPFANINHRAFNFPAAMNHFYTTTPQQALVPADLICSGQSLVDNIYRAISTSRSSTVGNINSGRSALDLLNVKVNLSRDTVYALFKGQIPTAGDIITLNLTDDIMMVGSPSDDISPITFSFIYSDISSKTRYNNNVLVWNLSENDFTCNQKIFNDVLGHLFYDP